MPLYPPVLALPTPSAAQYYWTTSPGANTTSATHGVATLRLSPWVVTRTCTIDRVGAEVTSAGDAASKVRLGIYADNGNAYPGALLLDAGQINGDSATVQEITISALTLPPGLYWVGGAVQAVTVTQPTLRIGANWHAPVPLSAGTSAPSSANAIVGNQQASITGALPPTFTVTPSGIANAVRVFVRAA